MTAFPIGLSTQHPGYFIFLEPNVMYGLPSGVSN